MNPTIRVSVVPYTEEDRIPGEETIYTNMYCVRLVGDEQVIERMFGDSMTWTSASAEDEAFFVCYMDTPDKKEANAKAKELRQQIKQAVRQ